MSQDEPTPAQVAVLTKYANNPRVPAPIRFGINESIKDGTLTFQDADAMIGLLKPWGNSPVGDRVFEPGVYINPDTQDVYEVVRSGSGRLYGKLLVTIRQGVRNATNDGWDEFPVWNWEYAGGSVGKLRASWRLTKEQAKEWGDYFQHCIKCHIRLTKPSSIARGMGDICAGKI